MPDENGQKFAGKFDTPEKLIDGIGEGIKLLGGSPDERIGIGEGKMFKDTAAAEAYYKTIESGIGAVSGFKKKTEPEKKADGKPDDKPAPEPKPEPKKTDGGNPIDDLLLGGDGQDQIDFDKADIDTIRKHAGLTPEVEAAMADRFLKDKKLSDEDFQILKKAGFSSRALAERHVQLEIEAAQSRVYGAASKAKADAIRVMGGEAELKTVLDWARTNVDKAVIQANDAAVKSNPAMFVTVASAYKAMYEAQVGKVTPPVRGGVSTPSGSSGGPLTNADIKKLNARIAQGDKEAAKELAARMQTGGYAMRSA